MLITTGLFEKIQSDLGLDELEPAVRDAIIDRFGTDVITKAVAEFLVTQGEWEQAAFETWISEHEHDEAMLEQLVMLYPEFGKILVAELLKLKKVFRENKN